MRLGPVSRERRMMMTINAIAMAARTAPAMSRIFGRAAVCGEAMANCGSRAALAAAGGMGAGEIVTGLGVGRSTGPGLVTGGGVAATGLGVSSGFSVFSVCGGVGMETSGFSMTTGGGVSLCGGGTGSASTLAIVCGGCS